MKMFLLTLLIPFSVFAETPVTEQNFLDNPAFDPASPQAEAIGVTAEQFAEAMGPEHLIAARDAFFEEWIAFFRRLRRPDEETALTKLQSLQKTAVEVVRKRAEAELAALQETFGKELDEHLSKLLANSPGWLESIQSHTPGESSTPAQTESAKLAA